MKKYFYIFIVFVLVLSCCNDDCSIENINDNLCGGQNLGIDELSRFSWIYYTPVNGTEVIEQSYSRRWLWRTYNDTIEVAGEVDFGGSIIITKRRHMFFKKNKDCISYLSTIDVFYNPYDISINNIPSGFTWQNHNDLQFKLQKYRKDKILIGEVSVDGISGTKFWMEFTPDVHRTFPYDYEQYYHN